MTTDKNPLVSIIVPVYNTQVYLERCIKSLLNQEYPNIEIILIDDGSSDNSLFICEKYQTDDRVVIIHQENSGVSMARNNGLDRARGDYISFVDSDDFVSPYFISHAVGEIEKHDADIVLFDFYQIKSGKSVLPVPDFHKKYKNELRKGNINIKKLLIADFVPNYMWNKLFKRSLWETVRFPVQYKYEDLFILIHVLDRANVIVYLPERLYYYNRDNVNSITSFLSIMQPFTRYCHFKALYERYDILSSFSWGGNVKKIVGSKVMKEAIETMVIQYGNPSLADKQVKEVMEFIHHERRNSTIKIGIKSSIIKWALCNFPLIVKYYGQKRYKRKMKK